MGKKPGLTAQQCGEKNLSKDKDQVTAMATTATAEPAVKAEDVLGHKFDKCLVDTSIKVGTGLVVGSVFSLLLFKRRMWPVTFGLGTGFGMGYANCQNDINSRK